MTAKYTPGPWQVIPVSPSILTEYCIDGGDRTVAHEIENEADALLIAAAPDMLKALKAARPIVQNFADGNEATYDAVCDAIAKAEGTALALHQGEP